MAAAIAIMAEEENMEQDSWKTWSSLNNEKENMETEAWKTLGLLILYVQTGMK